MNFAEIAGMYPKSGAQLEQYVRRIKPPLTMECLSLSFHSEDNRKLNIPVTGHASLLLSYKGKEGSVLSFGVDDDQLSILQIQGAKGGKGYRVNKGVKILDLYVAEIRAIVAHPEAGVRRIILPDEIKGLWAAESEIAACKYTVLAQRLGLIQSKSERAFVLDL